MEDKNYLQEAFKAFDALNEEVFDISLADGLDKAKEFEDEIAIDDSAIVVIDPEAEVEEDVEESYIGKAIMKCEICQSLIYKDPSEVVVDEELQLANVEEPCPYCQSEDGFKIVGQVCEFCKDGECEEEHEETEVEEVKEEPTEEIESEEEKVEDKIEEALESNSDKDQKTLDSLTESDKPAATAIEDAQKWVDFDMKRYGKISGRTNRLVKKAGFQIVKDDHGDYEVVAGKFESCEESLKEDFEKVEIETDKEKMTMESEENGKVTVITEPKEEVVEEEKVEEEEMIEPVTDEVKAEIEAEEVKPEEESEEISFDEFEESDFDSLGEGYLKRVYENVDAYKTVSGSIKGNKLMLEGIITFKSGKKAKTNFIFEADKVTKTGKMKFLGENSQFAKGKKSFILTGKAKDNKLFCESLNYNYVAKNKDGESRRLYGTITK